MLQHVSSLLLLGRKVPAPKDIVVDHYLYLEAESDCESSLHFVVGSNFHHELENKLAHAPFVWFEDDNYLPRISCH